MSKALELFYKLTNIKAYKTRKIKDGITNINYKIFSNEGVFVMRIPRQNMVGIDYNRQADILPLVSDLNVKIIYYNKDNGILISKFVKQDKTKEVSYDVVVKHLKKLHSIKSDKIGLFDPFNMINTYKNEINQTLFDNEDIVIKKAKALYEKYPIVLCHNDVLYANFILGYNKEYLIDYEYAGGNISLFDIASFLSENNIDDTNKQHQFINMYFDYSDETLVEDINIMSRFLDVLWAYWAKAMYLKYQEEIFLLIYNDKVNRYLSKTCNY